jgi:hypothetical protein
MAKNTNPNPGRSKIRLVFVDADLANGEIQELTNALSQAFKPVPVIIKGSTATKALPRGSDLSGVFEPDEEPEDDDPFDEVTELDTDVKPTKPRKYRSPKVVEIDMAAGGKPFREFALEKGNPTEHASRYLLASYWLSEHGGIQPVSVDHVYTCYKSAGWTFNVTDPAFPFRHLKKEGQGDVKRAQFTINHIGKARVEEMGAAES